MNFERFKICFAAAVLASLVSSSALAEDCTDRNLTPAQREACLDREALRILNQQTQGAPARAAEHPFMVRLEHLTVKNRDAGTQASGYAAGIRFDYQARDVGGRVVGDVEYGHLADGRNVGHAIGEVSTTGAVGFQAGIGNIHTPSSRQSFVAYIGPRINTAVGSIGASMSLAPGTFTDQGEDSNGSRLGLDAFVQANVWKLKLDGKFGIGSLSGMHTESERISSAIVTNLDGTVTKTDVIRPGFTQSSKFGANNVLWSVGATGQITNRLGVRAQWISERNTYNVVQDLTGAASTRSNRSGQIRVGGSFSFGAASRSVTGR